MREEKDAESKKKTSPDIPDMELSAEETENVKGGYTTKKQISQAEWEKLASTNDWTK